MPEPFVTHPDTPDPGARPGTSGSWAIVRVDAAGDLETIDVDLGRDRAYGRACQLADAEPHATHARYYIESADGARTIEID